MKKIRIAHGPGEDFELKVNEKEEENEVIITAKLKIDKNYKRASKKTESTEEIIKALRSYLK